MTRRTLDRFTFHRKLAVPLVAVLALGACVEKPQKLGADDEKLRKEVVLAKEPTPQHPLEIDFEQKVRLLGYDLDAKVVQEGQPFKVTWYWYVEHPPGAGWKVFTHLADAERRSRLNLDATRVVRRVYPLEQWKKGEYIKDVQEVTLPANWDSPKAIFYLGVYRDDQRLHVSKGPHDGEHRAEALQLDVGAHGASPDTLPRILARHVAEPITVDGKLDDPAWTDAQPSGPFVDSMQGNKGAFEASARVLYGATHLYVSFQVSDDDLRSSHQGHDDHLWEQDAVELMIDPDGDGRHYFEIQVSPRGIVFDTRQEAPRMPKPFGDVAWSSEAVVKVVLDGTLDDETADRGYVAEIALPWTAFASGGAPTPPQGGDIWRVNLFVLNAAGAGQRAVAWSPPKVGDFHVPARFGRLAFPRPAVTPPASLQPPPAPGERVPTRERDSPAPAAPPAK